MQFPPNDQPHGRSNNIVHLDHAPYQSSLFETCPKNYRNGLVLKLPSDFTCVQVDTRRSDQ